MSRLHLTETSQRLRGELEGPSRTIIVEPIETPVPAPEPAPEPSREPVREPEKVPA